MIYNKIEISEMTRSQAEAALSATARKFRVEEPLISDMSNWAILDDIANQLLWLEDRISDIDQQARNEESSQRMQALNAARV